MTKSDILSDEKRKNDKIRSVEGEFIRGISKFRHKLGKGSNFPSEPNRYHLFIALNCPWCHRVTLARNTLGLEKSITMDIVFPNRTGEEDPIAQSLWEFNPDRIATLTGEILPNVPEIQALATTIGWLNKSMKRRTQTRRPYLFSMIKFKRLLFPMKAQRSCEC